MAISKYLNYFSLFHFVLHLIKSRQFDNANLVLFFDLYSNYLEPNFLSNFLINKLIQYLKNLFLFNAKIKLIFTF